MEEPHTLPGRGEAPRWHERSVTYKVAAVVMIAIGGGLAWLGSASIVPTFVPFLVVWVLSFLLGLALSKVVRDRAWMRQKRAAVVFVALVALSYLPVVVYRENVGNTLVFLAMAALQGVGAAFGFHAPWLYGGKASRQDIRRAEDFLAAIDREK